MSSVHIVCPHCTTSYVIDPATLGVAGRTVRCSRCKEVWLARPEDAVAVAASVARDGDRPSARERDAAAEWEALARADDRRERRRAGDRQPLDIGGLVRRAYLGGRSRLARGGPERAYGRSA